MIQAAPAGVTDLAGRGTEQQRACWHSPGR